MRLRSGHRSTAGSPWQRWTLATGGHQQSSGDTEWTANSNSSPQEEFVESATVLDRGLLRLGARQDLSEPGPPEEQWTQARAAGAGARLSWRNRRGVPLWGRGPASFLIPQSFLAMAAIQLFDTALLKHSDSKGLGIPSAFPVRAADVGRGRIPRQWRGRRQRARTARAHCPNTAGSARQRDPHHSSTIPARSHPHDSESRQSGTARE